MLPARRVDLAGKPEELFIVQWAGGLEALDRALTGAGWSGSPHWTWSASLSYLDPGNKLADLLPRPALHEGRQAQATFIKPIADDDNRRLVLRAWKTDFEIDDGTAVRPLYLVSIARDVLKRGLELYAVPSVQRAKPEEVVAALEMLSNVEGAHKIATTGDTQGKPPVLMLADSPDAGRTAAHAP
jgi:hypothetical protein